MSSSLKRQIVVFALVFFILLIVFDWIQFGMGTPQDVPAKLITTVIATALYGGVMVWLEKRKNRGD